MTAEGICEKLGGHLTSIHSMFENAFVGEQGSSLFTGSNDFWTGANKLLKPGLWSWMDGTSFDFADWEKGQPKNFTNSNCGTIIMESNIWNSDDCNKKKPFVCMVKTSSSPATTTPKPIPKTCPPSWTYYVVNGTTGYCYKVFDNATWIDAEDSCKVHGSHLASVHILDE
uniref:C-type lectin domain-containing protein n=1 Tax=Panagrolaimus sp. ES5 TaxID=591445 RepID=A0AC34GC99_9BILA